MECDDPLIFRLPQEIRDEIYKHVVLEHEEIHLNPEPQTPPLRLSSEVLFQPRYYARILTNEALDGSNARVTTSAPICKVNAQLRREVSELLESSSLPVIATVRDFNFDHILEYMTTPVSKPRVARHTCREDGTVQQRLIIELSGPYGERWQQNLMRWINGIEKLLPEHRAEFGALHKTVPWQGRWAVRTPQDVLWQVGSMLRMRPLGAGRLELNKVFLALYGRYRVEDMLNWHVSAALDGRPIYFGPWVEGRLSQNEQQVVCLRCGGDHGAARV